MTEDERFIDIAERAIAQSLDEIVLLQPAERLAGYAICTDDDLMTVFWVAVTHEYLRTASDPTVRYIPVEWPYGYKSVAFDEAQREIQNRYERSGEGDQFIKHVESSFNALVAALHRTKVSGRLNDDAVLIVTSTDPGPYLEELAIKGVKILNSSELFEEWRKVNNPDSDN